MHFFTGSEAMKIMECWQNGDTYSEIADKTGIPVGDIYYIMNGGDKANDGMTADEVKKFHEEWDKACRDVWEGAGNAKTRQHSEEEVRRAIELRKRGLTYMEISKQMNVSVNWLYTVFRDNNLTLTEGNGERTASNGKDVDFPKFKIEWEDACRLVRKGAGWD